MKGDGETCLPFLPGSAFALCVIGAAEADDDDGHESKNLKDWDYCHDGDFCRICLGRACSGGHGENSGSSVLRGFWFVIQSCL